MATKKTTKKKNVNKKKISTRKSKVPVVVNVVNDYEPTHDLSLKEMLEDTLHRLSVLEAQEEKRDAVIKMLIGTTERLVKEKEFLLKALGWQSLKQA